MAALQLGGKAVKIGARKQGHTQPQHGQRPGRQQLRGTALQHRLGKGGIAGIAELLVEQSRQLTGEELSSFPARKKHSTAFLLLSALR